MFNLFNKNKVKAGKQTQPASKPSEKRESPLMALKGSWKKLNSMDRKQAYTWGAVALVGLVALMLLGSAASNKPEDFTEYESRGYDLANMPFSSDEAEQYLLASKYPDMQEGNNTGLYSEEEKAARQAEDEENEEDEEAVGENSNYRDSRYGGNGGYYGGSGKRGGSGVKTQIGNMSSASLKGASGSAMGGTFGPRGDFSNFKSQNKGSDKAPTGPGSGSARKALFQAAQGSRAAAGIKDNRLANAKRAMMGGNIDGSKAFTEGGVNLGDAKGLNLDTNAPTDIPGLNDLDDKLQDAKDKAEKDDKEEEKEWWKTLLEGLAEQALQGLLRIGEQALGNAVQNWQQDARAQRIGEQTKRQEQINEINKAYEAYENATGDEKTQLAKFTTSDGVEVDFTRDLTFNPPNSGDELSRRQTRQNNRAQNKWDKAGSVGEKIVDLSGLSEDFSGFQVTAGNYNVQNRRDYGSTYNMGGSSNSGQSITLENGVEVRGTLRSDGTFKGQDGKIYKNNGSSGTPKWGIK